ncbi:alpha/beta fold hydrolase [Streptomyces sp. NPDC057199]|uniref:alpha/beta fold hydrolase n=1 Tax=Streptomyces sp. NPDC057199 TaxID=3346047 RepID=UPI00363B337A
MPITTSKDGTKIAYQTRGDGPLGVVLVHGWSCTGSTWNRMLDQLPTEGRAFVQIDLRGHGGSAAEGLEHTVERYAEDITAAATAAGFDKFITVGHSMGGKYARHIRVIAGDRLLGQVAVAPTPSCCVEEEADEETIARMASNAGNVEAMMGVLAYITNGALSEEIARPLAVEAATITGEVLAASMRAFAREDVTAELVAAGEAPPTIVIGCADDPLYSPATLKARIPIENPKAKLSIIRSGHDPLHEAPAELAALIDNFLSDIDAAAK